MRSILPLFISLGIWLLFWQSLDIHTYKDFHTSQNQSTQYISWEEKFYSNLEIRQSPQSEKWIIDMIDWTKNTLHVATYMFTLPSLREAIIRAKNRGVDVKIILEKNPYNATSINRETEAIFQKNGVILHQSSTRYFSFMHAKYMIFDTKWIISTANWTRSSFDKNREFFVVWDTSEIRDELETAFHNDFTWKKKSFPTSSILIGPTNARERLLWFMRSTKEKLYIYTPDFSDKKLQTEVQQLCLSGKIIHILINYTDIDKKNLVNSHKTDCPNIRMMKSPSLHAKAMIRDNQKIFIWSFNFTQNSLENNREIGIFLEKNDNSIIVNSFQSDWLKSVDF